MDIDVYYSWDVTGFYGNIQLQTSANTEQAIILGAKINTTVTIAVWLATGYKWKPAR